MKTGQGKRFVDDYIAQLIAEGRIQRKQLPGENNYMLSVNEEEMRVAA
jgi:hypothetical protein